MDVSECKLFLHSIFVCKKSPDFTVLGKLSILRKHCNKKAKQKPVLRTRCLIESGRPTFSEVIKHKTNITKRYIGYVREQIWDLGP